MAEELWLSSARWIRQPLAGIGGGDVSALVLEMRRIASDGMRLSSIGRTFNI